MVTVMQPPSLSLPVASINTFTPTTATYLPSTLYALPSSHQTLYQLSIHNTPNHFLMDSRRSTRAVIDPMVRQVGFVTPNAAPPDRAHSVPAISSSPSISDLSPVMIPPPRHASDNILAALAAPPARAIPVPGAARRAPLEPVPRGSYNPADSVLGASPSGNTDEASDDAGWSKGVGSAKAAGLSFPAAGVDVAAGKAASNLQPVGSAVPNLPSTILAKDGNVVIDNKNFRTLPVKKETSKAERRALQEAQRAAKAAAKDAGKSSKDAVGLISKQPKSGKGTSQKKVDAAASPSAVVAEKKVAERSVEKERKKEMPRPRMQFDDVQGVEKAKRRAIVNQMEARNRVELFGHLPQYIHGTQLPDLQMKFFQLEPMHLAVYKVGLQYLTGDISGGNARCIAMMQAFREAVKDYSTPPNKTVTRDLTTRISSYVSFLNECRPLSISMGNAIRFLKNRIGKLPPTISEVEAKAMIQSDIDRFVNEKIIIAGKVIVEHAVSKIRNGDALLTYSTSSLVELVLLRAHELGKQFRVVVVDSRPKLEGQSLLWRLVSKGLSCTYTHLNAISYIMHEVTRVFLGAASVFSNGTVYSRVGTACVAMVAHEFRVPVLICCEAYKFHERVQLDSICSNELGDPDAISKVQGKKELTELKGWADHENLQLLNLVYDVTPADYVSMVVTDYGMVPPTSVPVIVREYRREHLWT